MGSETSIRLGIKSYFADMVPSTSDSILALFLFNSYPFWSDSQLNRDMWPEFKSLAALSAATL